MNIQHAPIPVRPADLSDDELQRVVFPTCDIPSITDRYLRRKYGIEWCMALVLFLVFLPLIAVLMVLVRLNSKGPAIYAQKRTGQDGKTFTIYKLRTMYHGVEQYSGKAWSQPGDSRVTRLGRFLRFTHLDELPQLWNVLRGEMTLVGPRPERPEFVQVLINRIENYYRRHALRPGITGLAQIYLPPDDSLDSVKLKIRYDLIYLRHACLSLDLRIWLCTALRLVGVRYGYGPRWVGLSSQLNRFKEERRREQLQRMNQASGQTQRKDEPHQESEFWRTFVEDFKARPRNNASSQPVASTYDSSDVFLFDSAEFDDEPSGRHSIPR